VGGRPSVGDVGRGRRSVGEVMKSDLCGAVGAPTPFDEVFSREWMSALMETIFDECRTLRAAAA